MICVEDIECKRSILRQIRELKILNVNLSLEANSRFVFKVLNVISV